MTKSIIITDTHFGIRKNNPFILKHQEYYFSKIFFPIIDKLNIKRIYHLGDLFDSRQNLHILMLNEVKRFFFEEIRKRNIEVIICLGNHDCFYTNTNDINSVNAITKEYGWEIIKHPITKNINGLNICFLPWITSENKEDSP